MYELRVVVLAQSLLVALQMIQAGQRNGAEGSDCRHSAVGRDRQRLDRLPRLIGQNAVAALELAGSFGVQLQLRLQFASNGKEVGNSARAQFETDLADCLTPSRSLDPATVEGQFDAHAVTRLEHPGATAETGGKCRLEVFTDGLEQGAQAAVGNVREIEIARRAGNFPLAICARVVAGQANPTDR